MTHHHTRWVHQGVHISLLAAIACAVVQPVCANSNAQQTSGPTPIRAALDLLHWPPDETPRIVVVANRIQAVNVLAEGWVIYVTNGIALPTIYVAG